MITVFLKEKVNTHTRSLSRIFKHLVVFDMSKHLSSCKGRPKGLHVRM